MTGWALVPIVESMAQALAQAPTVHRITRAEYSRLAESGFFEGQRVELLEGEIIHMAAKLVPHVYTVRCLNYALVRRLGPEFIVQIQDPIVLDDWSEPEPDVSVCRAVPDNYAKALPEATQVVLAIEVAETSLRYDLKRKVPAYAAAGVAAAWVVDLKRRRVHVFAEPEPAGRRYRVQRIATERESLPLPDGSDIAIAEFLPPA